MTDPASREMDALVRDLTRAMAKLDAQEQRTALTLYRLLAEGHPVDKGRLAERAAVSLDVVRRLVDDQPGAYVDERDRVIGFLGLALPAMPHRLTVDGRSLHAWCAWDTLFLPELIGTPVAVQSSCPATEQTITLTVTPEGVRDISPAEAVLSFLRPEEPLDADLIKTFCHFIHFFASRDAADGWTVTHPGTFVLTIDEGFEIGRRVNHAVFGAALAAPA